MTPDTAVTSPVKSRHKMPFGPEQLPGGKTAFRLWAPQAHSVELCLYGTAWEAGQVPRNIIPMQAAGDGWYAIEASNLHAGDLYHFRINQNLMVPDPASRYQPYDVHGPSEVVDPDSYHWQDSNYKGRPWHEAVFYELHTGTFTPQGTFSSLHEKLDYLQQLGITAIELMPVSDFPGRWNWGYDGVLPFAPDSAYGRPEDLKAFIDAAHAKNMMVFLDVVYNHFGPEGNYLHTYAESFFNKEHHTPWGAAINLDGENNYWVRQFFIQNALYWLDEFHFDGLRLDAVHALCDDSEKHFLTEFSESVKEHFKDSDRQVHIVLENDDNAARFLKHPPTRAQWNDDFHHAAHILLTGEEHGYYADYRNTDRDPVDFLGRCLTEGFAYQGEISPFRNNTQRGESSRDLPYTAFVNFIQNHDQTGNRALGDRLYHLSKLEHLKALAAIYLLAPGIPMLFMGEEFGCEQPFLFFCDLGGDLRASVTEGRRREFAAFPEFSNPESMAQIPDPCADDTFQKTVLDWHQFKSDWYKFYQQLLKIRHQAIIPRLGHPQKARSTYRRLGEKAFMCTWAMGDGRVLSLKANLGQVPCEISPIKGSVIYASREALGRDAHNSLQNGDVLWTLEEEKPQAEIPLATYRLQLNRHFTFDDAMGVIPYLKDLGISTCYTSPLLCSQPGSMHGYDITNHRQVDPEIGGDEKLKAFVAQLQQNNMGLLVDIVPNHMGIGHSNPWWMEVLEDGQASRYARYFDIDWHFIKEELNGKVLVPILGDHYGKVLENGEISPGFDEKTGRLTFHYYEHLLPVNPVSYPSVLKHRLGLLEQILGGNQAAYNEYLSIITAFEHLPVHNTDNPELQEERVREKNIANNRLSTLCMQVPEINAFIHQSLDDFKTSNRSPENTHRLHELLEAQAYRLAYWRVAMDEINYRRFFDVNTLAALRMEDPDVFSDTHARILELVADKSISGLRIDHPDGLYDPEAYFDRLQQKAGEALDESSEKPLYIVVEKILAPFEHLPTNWPVHGTTGYDFSSSLNGLFVDSQSEKALNRIYKNFTGHAGDRESYEKLVHACKKKIMQTTLASELNVLAHQLNRISEKNLNTRDYTLRQIRNALMDVIACFPVYRTYISNRGISRKDHDYIEWAVSAAKKSTTIMDASIFDFIKDVLLQETDGASPEEVLSFTMHFQQYTSPVMAKSVEDTAFYRFNRLSSLNEVGADPDRFGSSIPAFHFQNQERLNNFPHSLLATSTHDTKRSEDVRAKISVLSEIPDLWKQAVNRWARFNRLKKTEINGKMAPDKNDEYLFYQSLLGIWPVDDSPEHEIDKALLAELSARLQQYMIKAVREAKVHSNWINQDATYEEAFSQFIERVLQPKKTNKFLDDLRRFHAEIYKSGLRNSLSAVLLKQTSPGVPDIYQGQEDWNFSLVDPDNRRPVDYHQLREKLANIQPFLKLPEDERKHALDNMLDTLQDGRIKLYVTSSTLQARQKLKELFQNGDYTPLEVTGDYSEHIIAFARSNEHDVAITVATRLNYQLQNKTISGHISLPDGLNTSEFQNIYTSHRIDVNDNQLSLPDVLQNFPVALLTGKRIKA